MTNAVVMKLPGLFYDAGTADEPDLKWVCQPFKIIYEQGDYLMSFDNHRVKVAPYYKDSSVTIFNTLRKLGFDMTEDKGLVDKFFSYIHEQCYE